jgi:HPt (histidine-containing phosphotransfer) domain-containing protein
VYFLAVSKKLCAMKNMEEIKRIIGNDETFITRLMEKFMAESGIDVQRLNSAVEGKNWPAVRAVAHKMLGSTRIFALEELNEPLEMIEDLAESSRYLDKVPSLMTQVLAAWDTSVREMREEVRKMKLRLH